MSRTPFCAVGAGRAGCSAGAFDSAAQQSDCGSAQQWQPAGADSEPHVTRTPAGAKSTPRQIAKATMALHTRTGSDVFIVGLESHSRVPVQSDIPRTLARGKSRWSVPPDSSTLAAVNTILHQLAHSPFCIPIAQALRAAGAEFETREVPNWDRSELLRLTGGAYYAVPVLQHGGRIIFESGTDTQDVARFVDDTWFGGRLFPADIEAAHLCVIEFLENEVEARTFKLVDIHWIPTIPDVAHRGMVIRHKERKFGRGCVDAWRRDAVQIRAELDALLVRFEMTLQRRSFLFGDTPVYADFLLFGVLGNLTFNGWNQLAPAQKAIAEWRDLLAGWRVSDTGAALQPVEKC